MVVFNETLVIANAKKEEWLQWMKEVQIPTILETGLISEAKIMIVRGQDESEATTFAIHLTAETDADFQKYASQHFETFVQTQKKKFQGHYNNFKTLLTVVHSA